MSKYSEFFLQSASSIVELETLEISHPSFSQTHYVVRNAMSGITATLEDGTTTVNFQYYPLAIKRSGASDDLDQKLEIQLGDLGEIIPNEFDNCIAADTTDVKPTLIYRTYRSDDLTAPLNGPFKYEIPSIGSLGPNSAFTAQAPRLNTNRTGEIYAIDRFPMLSAFL